MGIKVHNGSIHGGASETDLLPFKINYEPWRESETPLPLCDPNRTVVNISIRLIYFKTNYIKTFIFEVFILNNNKTE